MKLSDEKRIEAPRAAVWAGLNDPEILRQSIPGCETLEQISETEFTAEVRAKVGPVKAKFKGAVQLSDLNPPQSYRISGEGKGGAAGFAKGGADITLEEDGDVTILKYDVNADVGGKLAQIGGRLVEGTAKKLAGEFFDNFEAAIKADGQSTDAADAEATVSEDTSAEMASMPPPRDVQTAREVRAGGRAKYWMVLGMVFVVGALILTFLQ